MKKMRVLMVEVGGWGGIAHYTYNLMQALAQINEIDCLLLTDTHYELEMFPRAFALRKTPLKDQSHAAATRNIIKAILSFRPQVLHVQNLLTARKDWLLFILGRICGLKIVFTAHNVLPHEPEEQNAFFMRSAYRMIYSAAGAIIIHAQASKNKLMALFDIAAEKIFVIPHGDYLFFRQKEIPQEEAKRLLEIPVDKKVILHFGTIRGYKGIDTLLSAFSQLRKAHNDVILLLAGKTMHIDKEELRHLIKGLEIEDKLIFKDEYLSFDEINTCFFAADIAVFAYSDTDTSGSLQVAYAFSKPVIATDTGGLREVVEEGDNGILVPPGDDEKLRDAFKRILWDQELLRTMGSRSLQLAKDKFSWGKIALSTLEVYRQEV
ncbi:MAG: glycosyltransferase family 4 protein [Candidatus Omnitrophica bacterium]|nr:glycosyltransferase family 4 protein [Candidatus Omnitrophota bacterium]